MRTLTPVAITLLTCAISCTPTPSGIAPDSLPAVPDPFFTERIDSARAASGQWFSRSDEGLHAACFGAPQSECQLSIQCEAPTGTLTVAVAEEVAPEQNAAIEIHTEQHSMTLFAQSHNEGLPTVIATLAADSLDRPGLLQVLNTRPARFAIQAHPLDSAETDLVRYPWDDSIARVLAACED